jgi:hypothetical protein
MSLNNLIDNIL